MLTTDEDTRVFLQLKIDELYSAASEWKQEPERSQVPEREEVLMTMLERLIEITKPGDFCRIERWALAQSLLIDVARRNPDGRKANLTNIMSFLFSA